MAATQHFYFLPSLMLLLLLAFSSFESTQASYEAKDMVEVVVEGVVYCQKCESFGTWSLTGAEPILSAKVGVICKDYKGRVSFYKAFMTNGNGYFYTPLQGLEMNHYYLDHPLQSCTVRLISSPHPDCNLLTNVNHGVEGSPLRFEKKRLSGVNYEAVVYAAGPLAFRPANCSVKTHY
ncbi:non-classical arabinogalactan protein 30-like [Tasmannia lanceolata]|uniref:non-classical arabinogalactan protein 30-like n=1 Tax=Tasmannia lanceolata TaxID=3420 RepID=UPI0040632781